MEQSKVKKIIKILNTEYKGADIALEFSNVFELMVATILSAQCTDKQVNSVTKNLFKKYKTIRDYANADLKEFEKDIKSTGFYRNKAKNIIATANMVLNNFGGVVPKTMEELTTLKGVARKTANIVLGSGYGINVGIAVDTHVIRLSNLIGFSKNSDPKKIEQDLMKIVPQKDWRNFSFLIQTLGRRVCIARRPKCGICPIRELCERGTTAEKLKSLEQ